MPDNPKMRQCLNYNAGILAHNPLLQLCRHLRKSLDSDAVLSCLPDQEDAHCLLGHAHHPRYVRHMGGTERFSELHSRVEILGSRDTWILSEHERTLVLQCQHAHHNRSGNSAHANSRTLHVGPAEETEACPNGHLCSGWLVRPTVHSQ
jgi:hypothetical protein